MPRRACEDSTGLRYEIGVLLSATASPVAVYQGQVKPPHLNWVILEARVVIFYLEPLFIFFIKKKRRFIVVFICLGIIFPRDALIKMVCISFAWFF